MSTNHKARAIDFYRMAFEGNPREAVKLYVGDTYIQHNPLVEDGPEGFITYFERMAEEHPEKSVAFLREVEEEDLDALHTHQVWPGDGEYITMDFFRFDADGRIVEHWDAIQQVPEDSQNDNGMM